MRNGYLCALAALVAVTGVVRAANDAIVPGVPLSSDLAPGDYRAGLKSPPITVAADEPAEAPPKQPAPKTAEPAAPAPKTAEPATDAFSEHCCQPCGERMWADAEYLLWWVKDGNIPIPMVLSASPSATAFGVGLPGNTVLFGPSSIDYGSFSGARAALGVWLDSDQRIGVDVGGFFLQTRQVHLFNTAQGANSLSSLGFSFVDAGQEIGEVFGGPATGTGAAITIDSSSRLYSVELNARTRLTRGGRFRLDGLVGFRWIELREDLSIFADQTDSAGNVLDSFVDQFQARNNFYGGQVGADLAYNFGRWGVSACGKIALGDMHQEVDTNGSNNNGSGFGEPGGIYTFTTNIGRQSHDQFGVVPEARCGAFFDITHNLSVRVGYTFLYLNSVVRPGDQIDRSLIPQPQFNKTDYWAQGVDFGIAIRY